MSTHDPFRISVEEVPDAPAGELAVRIQVHAGEQAIRAVIVGLWAMFGDMTRSDIINELTHYHTDEQARLPDLARAMTGEKIPGLRIVDLARHRREEFRE